jgi:hypothetical protein
MEENQKFLGVLHKVQGNFSCGIKSFRPLVLLYDTVLATIAFSLRVSRLSDAYDTCGLLYCICRKDI